MRHVALNTPTCGTVGHLKVTSRGQNRAQNLKSVALAVLKIFLGV